MVIWTDPAKLDLRDIHDYIARDSKYYAQKVSQDIVDKSEKLNLFQRSEGLSRKQTILMSEKSLSIPTALSTKFCQIVCKSLH